MIPVCAIFLLCLISGIHSAHLVCERLVHPLKQLEPRHLEGRWALVAGSLSYSPSMDALRQRDSITIYFSNSSDSSTISYTQINRFGDQCQSLPYNISMEDGTFDFDVGDRFQLTGAFLNTSCPDCVVMRWIVKSKRRVSIDLYLLSRRRIVTQEERDEFMAQLLCLQLPPPVFLNPFAPLCEEQSEIQPTELAAEVQTEEKTKEAEA